jgi:ubiquinone biosynthesis monooxygenase Coq7
MDRFILAFDRVLRTLCAPATSSRPHPDADIMEAPLSDIERKHAAGLMRVNHCGEVCAQALYQGQALTARDTSSKEALMHAAEEEVEHLAWTAQRVHELGGRTSIFNPLWYLGSLTIGVTAGLIGDKWNLGFLEETEKQVGLHLQSHLESLPVEDAKSRAVVMQMYEDEMKHADMAYGLGAAQLPGIVQNGMKLTAKVMTGVSYYI